MANKYRVVTDGEVFRIQLFQSWTYRAGWFWLKTVTQEQWVFCDNIGGDCLDDDGWEDESEIVDYETVTEARSAILDFQKGEVVPEWKVVPPTI